MLSSNTRLPDGWQIITRRNGIGGSSMASCAAEGYIVVAGGEDSDDPITGEAIYTSSLHIFDVKKQSWITIPIAPYRLFSFGVFIVKGYLYVSYGVFASSLFRIKISAPERGWERMADFLHEKTSHGFVMDSYHNQCSAYVFGGYCGKALGCGERYDALADRWEDLPPLPEKRFQHSTVAVKHKIYLLGGKSEIRNNFTFLSSVLVYDVPSQTWTTAPDLPVASSGHSAVSIGKWIILIGGCKEESLETFHRKPITSIYLMNTDKQVWEESSISLPNLLCLHGSCVLQNNSRESGPRIGIIGGEMGKEQRPNGRYRYSANIMSIDFIRLLLKPKQSDGNYCLFEALEKGISWTEGLESIVNAQPNAVSENDPKTNLFPFMMAPDVNTSYELFRRSMDIVNSFQFSSNNTSCWELLPPLEKKPKLMDYEFMDCEYY